VAASPLPAVRHLGSRSNPLLIYATIGGYVHTTPRTGAAI